MIQPNININLHHFFHKNRKDIEKAYVNVAPLPIFWLTMFASQKIFGLPLLNLIPGNRILSSVSGLIVLCSNLYSSDFLYDKTSEYIFGKSDSKRKGTRAYRIQQFYVGTFIFVFLNQGTFFHTVLPSSVTKLGCFAKGNLGGYVAATSDKTTELQRAKIQKLGKIFGCHHCGDRQTFSRAGFIADHMPPSAFVEARNNNPIYKLLRIKKLWPQCQRCFKMQAYSVKRHLNGLSLFDPRPLVYHRGLYPYHLTYLLTKALCDQDEVLQFIKPLTDFTEDVFDKVESKFSTKLRALGLQSKN